MSSSVCAPRPPSTSSPHHPPVPALRIPRLSPSKISWTCIDNICLICSSPSKVSSHPLLTYFLLFICELILKRLHLTSPFVSVSPSVTEDWTSPNKDMDSISSHPEELLTITQDGRSIESYVEEFLHLIHQVNWNDDTLKIVFWSGLNNHLFLLGPPPTTTGSLAHYIELVLILAGSSFTMEEVPTSQMPPPHTEKPSPPAEKKTISPALSVIDPLTEAHVPAPRQRPLVPSPRKCSQFPLLVLPSTSSSPLVPSSSTECPRESEPPERPRGSEPPERPRESEPPELSRESVLSEHPQESVPSSLPSPPLAPPSSPSLPLVPSSSPSSPLAPSSSPSSPLVPSGSPSSPLAPSSSAHPERPPRVCASRAPPRVRASRAPHRACSSGMAPRGEPPQENVLGGPYTPCLCGRA